MHSNQMAWEREYRQRQLVTGDNRPQACVRRFLRFLKKQGIDLKTLDLLDLGCGTGRNTLAFAALGSRAIGIDCSPTAINTATQLMKEADLHADFRLGDIGTPYPFGTASFDLVLDVTASNALSAAQRAVYLHEVRRTLRPDGWLFVRALCKDGDKNAQNLLQLHPGLEPDTYVFPGLGITERVFTEADVRALYGEYFRIMELTKEEGYAHCNNQPYKRKYWILVLRPAV
jgi:SAM-dependent methyltransferase